MNNDSTQMEFTGERFMPEIQGDIELEHLHRYLKASELAKGKIVLDIASGEGYGSAMLANKAEKVIGVDISIQAIQHARNRYQKDNLEFMVGNCADIPLPDACVDMVVSFETIEHHDSHEKMMQEIKRVLRPDGILIISSPDKYNYSIEPGYHNEFHVKELYVHEFKQLLDEFFKNAVYFGQRVIYGSGIFSENLQTSSLNYVQENSAIKSVQGMMAPLYWIALASNSELPEFATGILEQAFSETESVRSLTENLAQRDRLINELNQTNDSLIVERDAYKQAMLERDVVTNEQDQQITMLGQTIDALVIEKDAYKQAMIERDVIINEQSQQIIALGQTIDALIIEKDTYKQAMVERDVISNEQTQQINRLNQAIAERDVAISAITNELHTILSSRSWKITGLYRQLGRVIRGDWAVIRSQAEKKNLAIAQMTSNTMINTQSAVMDLSISSVTTDSQNKRILLVSYFCPTRAHAGGLRILDIYTLIKTSFSEVTIDLYTYKRPEIDWSYSDVESLFDHIYFSPTENLSPDNISALSTNVSRYYDVIDLQFHQSAYYLEKWRAFGGKILFTPMESLVRCLAIDIRANLTRKSIFSLRKIISGLKCAAEEIVFASKADEVVCVSKTDASLLRTICRTKNINFLETALSTLEFADAINNPDKELRPELKENTIVYVAYFGSETNINALRWYLDKVHPLIIQAVPDYKLQVVGRGDLSVFDNDRSNSIDFIGEVDSLTPAINAAKIGIAPALNGSGLRGKINQYAIFGVPSVVSSISAKGLVYKEGVDIYITDEPAIFAERCIALLKDNELNKKIGQLAREKAFANYSWDSKIEAIRKTYALE